MTKRPGEPDDQQGTYLGLLAAAVLIVLGVWLVVAFKKSSDTLDCMAAGHHDCVPRPGQ